MNDDTPPPRVWWSPTLGPLTLSTINSGYQVRQSWYTVWELPADATELRPATALDVARDVARLWAPYMSTMERPVAVELVAALDRLVAALIADAWKPS